MARAVKPAINNLLAVNCPNATFSAVAETGAPSDLDIAEV